MAELKLDRRRIQQAECAGELPTGLSGVAKALKDPAWRAFENRGPTKRAFDNR